jgi:heme/copper-type cytochrome/quinol oxidase subunit 2
MEWYHVYLFTRLDGFSTFFTVVMVVMTIVIAMVAVFYIPLMSNFGDYHCPTIKKTTKTALIVWLIAIFMSLAIPTQKEMAAIYLLPRLAKSDFTKEASQIPTDAAKLMRLKLESWIADMEPTKPDTK